MKRILKLLVLTLFILFVFLIIKTVLYPSRQINVEPVKIIEIDNKSLYNLSKSISYKTISNEDYSLTDTSQFLLFQAFIDTAYSLIYKYLEKEKHGNNALLYKWQGKNASLKPLVLLAHQDVVPVIEENWEKDPFLGEIDDEFIWGRGTLDNKGSLISILEAVELLLNEGFIPMRTIYLAFGDDEEIGGDGARELVSVLKDRGVVAEMVLDEGMAITSGIVPMISAPVALIGTSEKGYLSVEITSISEGGHSSMPEKETAISILSNALVKITNNQFSSKFTPPIIDFLSYIGPEIPWPARIVFANQWLFSNVIKGVYSSTGSGNSLIRTTTAPTMLKAGIKDNVLPASATATINFRLLPGDSSEKIIAQLEKKINDNRISYSIVGNFKEPAEVSPINCAAFKMLNQTIMETYENTLVAPTLMTGSSDSYFYSEISSHIYRFAPYQITPENIDFFHGDNERITIESFKSMVNFYYHLVKNFQKEFY